MVIVQTGRLRNVPPFFTIITVVKNGALTLQRCMNSIETQTFQDFEYLVVAGTSSDKTYEIIDKNLHMIDVFISDADDGLYFAMNKGLKVAKGRYIGILNADDIYLTNTLELVHNAVKNHTDRNIIYGAMNYFDNPSQIHFIHSNELSKRMIFHPTVFVSNDTYKRRGYFNTKFKVAADYDFAMRCWKANESFYGLENVLATFSGGGTSAKLRFRSILETSEIQAKYNIEAKYFQLVKLMRTLSITYSRESLTIITVWLNLIIKKYFNYLKNII